MLLALAISLFSINSSYRQPNCYTILLSAVSLKAQKAVNYQQREPFPWLLG